MTAGPSLTVYREPAREVVGRGAIPGLRTPFPLAGQVPGMLAEDFFLCRFLDGLDEVLAPIVSVLDCFDAYLDTATAPADFLRYLGSWMLATLDDPWNETTLRRDVAQAHERARTAGTVAGLRDRIVPHAVKFVSIRDTGTTETSEQATDPADWRDAPDPIVRLVVTPHNPEGFDIARVEAMIRDVLPAHIGLELSTA